MRYDRNVAVRHLRRSDSVMRRMIDAVGTCELRPGARGDHFTTLLRAIVGQQLSSKAAETIWQRLIALHPNGRKLRPEDILAAPDAELRTCGLSRSKTAFAKDLAERVVTGELRLARMSRLPDEEVITRLVAVKGVGRWTAEMFLLFKLGRSDVWPVDDLGIRNAVQRAYGIEPSRDAMEVVAEPWRPYRSVASWYLWRSLALPPVSGSGVGGRSGGSAPRL